MTSSQKIQAILLYLVFLPSLLCAQKAEPIGSDSIRIFQNGQWLNLKRTALVFQHQNRYLNFNEYAKVRTQSRQNDKHLALLPVYSHHGQAFILRTKLLIATKPSQAKEILSSVKEVLKGRSFEWVPEPMGLADHALIEVQNTQDVMLLLRTFQEMPDLTYAQPLFARQLNDRALPNDPLLPQQWHLTNNFPIFFPFTQADINVLPVWGENYGDGFLGRGIRIGCVDSGLDTQHPDLINQVDSLNDIDFNEGDDDPRPLFSDERNSHGTSVGGLIAAEGNNVLGTIGASPEAELLGIRLTFSPVDDQTEALALNHMLLGDNALDIYNNSWGPSDDGQTKTGPGVLTKAALSNASQHGRDGKGAIFTWAAGNGRSSGDNANYDGYANSRYTIAVGAITFTGQATSYSEPGANVLLVAPSGGELLFNEPQITTTVHAGFPNPYTSGFNGTSASTPLVSGVIALMLEANPNLGWRDVQEILIRSALQNDPTNPDWFFNGGGFHFHPLYGAGLVDAEEAVHISHHWSNLPPAQSISQEEPNLARSIPDGSEEGTTFDFEFGEDLRVEHVELDAEISHSARGQLKIVLISPDGTESILADTHGDQQANYVWTFMSVRHWGEQAQGTWQVKVMDRVAGQSGQVESLTLRLYGTGNLSSPDLAIESFRLIHAETDTLIKVLEEGDTLYQDDLGDVPLSIEVVSSTEGSVRLGIWGLDTQTGSSRTENQAPFALFANAGSDYYGRKLAPQGYEVFAQAFDLDNLLGEVGDTSRLRFWILPTSAPNLSLSRLALVDAGLDEAILDSLVDGGTYLLEDLRNRELSFEAFTEPATVGSVRFEIMGPVSYSRTENVSPYIADGNAGSNYFGQVLDTGLYVLRVTPFSEVRGQGVRGSTREWQIQLSEPSQELDLWVYPNESDGRIQVEAKAGQRANLWVYDVQNGQVVYKKEGLRGDVFEPIEIQKEGLYIIQLQAGGEQVQKTVLIRK